jgi:hypothetical protein
MDTKAVESRRSKTTNYNLTIIFYTFVKNKTLMFKILAQINKIILPSFSKQRMDLAKAKKWQMAIIGFRYYVTTRAIN